MFYAPINSDGSVGTFLGSNMPVGRRRHTSWVVNDYIFVAGGSNPGYDTVYSGHVANDGSVPIWTLSPNTLPGKRFWHSSALYNNRAYVIGGIDDLGATKNTIFYATINNDAFVNGTLYLTDMFAGGLLTITGSAHIVGFLSVDNFIDADTLLVTTDVVVGNNISTNNINAILACIQKNFTILY